MYLRERDDETNRQHIEERCVGHRTNVHGNESFVHKEPQTMNPTLSDETFHGFVASLRV
jgi:hypothetical protein